MGKRAILVAMGLGLAITSAAALDAGGMRSHATGLHGTHDAVQVARARVAARERQRDLIEARYLASRARCDSLGGPRRDQCLIESHALRGVALLEAAAPYSD